jgi:hypothetical protein
LSVFRSEYRRLTAEEVQRIVEIKAAAEALYNLLPLDSREAAIARTKLEESVMWAVKGITE